MKGWQGLCLALTIVAAGCADYQVDVSADGRWLARASDAGLIFQSLTTGDRISVSKAKATSPKWSPNGKLLAIESNDIASIYQAGQSGLVPLRKGLVGPFGWNSSSNRLTGLHVIKKTIEAWTYDLRSKKITTRRTLPYKPDSLLETIDGSLVLSGPSDVGVLTRGKYRRLDKHRFISNLNYQAKTNTILWLETHELPMQKDDLASQSGQKFSVVSWEPKVGRKVLLDNVGLGDIAPEGRDVYIDSTSLNERGDLAISVFIDASPPGLWRDFRSQASANPKDLSRSDMELRHMGLELMAEKLSFSMHLIVVTAKDGARKVLDLDREGKGFEFLIQHREVLWAGNRKIVFMNDKTEKVLNLSTSQS